FPAAGWFGGQGPQDEGFEVKLAKVDSEASEIVTTVDGEPSHESALEVEKGSEVKVEAEFHFEDGSHYTTTSSEFVTWTVTPEDSGVTVDENGNIDTSGVTESVVVTITATGHGPFEGVTKTTTMTVTLPDIATLSGAACGGQLNDTDKENAKGACLKIATNSAGQWFTSTPSLPMMEALGYTLADGNVDTNGGRTYDRAYLEDGSYGPKGGAFAGFDQLAFNGGYGENGQFDRYCLDLSAMTFAGKSDWRRPTLEELESLYAAIGDMWAVSGWPTGGERYVSSSPVGDPGYYDVRMNSGAVGGTHPGNPGYASCVSGS
ncbi:DUF1566 domain-containing protein, partial [Vibrio navarrensis]